LLSGIFFLYFTDISISGIVRELMLFFGGLAGLMIGALISHYIIERLSERERSFFEIVKILK